MDRQDETDPSERRPMSSLSGGKHSVTTTSSLHRHLSPAFEQASCSSGDHEFMVASLAEGDAVFGRELSPYEVAACDGLTRQIRDISIAKTHNRHQNLTHSAPSLELAVRDAALTIRYNAKWFSESGLANLLKKAIEAASASSASVDLYATTTLIDTIAIYAQLPNRQFQSAVDFLCYAYYQGSRMNKFRRLREQAWLVSKHVLESHCGGQYVSVLLDVSRHDLEPKAGLASLAGALMIATDHVLLRKDAQDVPTLSILPLLVNLRDSDVAKDEFLREQVLYLLDAVLQSDEMRHDLDNSAGWEVLVDVADCCTAPSPTHRIAQSFVKDLAAWYSRFEATSLPTLGYMLSRADLPLPATLLGEMITPREDFLKNGALTEHSMHLLRGLGRHSSNAVQLESIVRKGLVELFIESPGLEPLTTFARTLQDMALDFVTCDEAAAVFARIIVQVFMYTLQSGGEGWDTERLYEIMCVMSHRCTDTATVLLEIRADAEGVVHIETASAQREDSTDERSSTNPKILYDLSYLPLQKLQSMLLDVLQESTDWKIYWHILERLPTLLGNHSMFESRMVFVKRLRGVICESFESGSHPEPPAGTTVPKSQAAVPMIQTLVSIISYYRHLSRRELLDTVSIFLNAAGTRDHTTSIACIHALTICCYELPDLMSSYMDDIIDKMSKIVTQKYLAIHVLQFLAGLSRLPDVFRNFKAHDYKKIFGVCGSYLQSIRGSNALTQRHQTPNSDRSSSMSGDSSDALPEYVYALAHHVIAFWYLGLRRSDRLELREYITTLLRYVGNDGREIIEDRGLVTVDLIDRVDAEPEGVQPDQHFGRVDGRTIVSHRLAGSLLLSTETALRTGKTVVTIRRATSTDVRVIDRSSSRSDSAERSVAVTVETSEQDYICVLPGDTDGRTYGKIMIPRSDSLMGASITLTLPEQDPVTRAMQSLDRTPALDSHKAGVIYIGESQSTEDEILRNGMGSPDYIDFLRHIGTLTRLKDATFNTQGLDRASDADGQHALVWRNEITELVFHATTLMPNNADPRLNTANKKRHIGNDFVNIVFNNSGAPFDFHTFPSQFNCVYIVIAPSARTSFLQTRTQAAVRESRDRFYTVQVLTRPGYPEVSSAAQEKVVSGASLPGYVRNLALNDCVFSLMWSQRDEAGEYPSSWRSRLQQLRRLRERYA